MNRLAPYAALAALLLLTRAPALLNAGTINSDGAVVGLQALRMLEGEWSRFIWAVTYQASLEAVLAAIVFALFGAGPLQLVLVPFAGYVLFAWTTLAILRRHLDARSAFVATLAIVLTPYALNSLSTLPPRQWAITIFFAALAWVDRAGRGPQARKHYAGATALAVLSTFVDLFTLQMMPAYLWFAVARARDEESEGPRRWSGALAVIAGFVVAMVATRLLRGSASQGVTDLSGSIPRNFKLLHESCLAWLLSYRTFIPGRELYPVLWSPAWPVRAIQFAGGLSFLAALLASAWLSIRSRTPLKIRRLGQFGTLVSGATLAGFLLSTKPSDVWAARYIAPLLLAAPFTLAPIAVALGRQRFALAMAPYLLVATIGGWVSWGPFVDGASIVRTERGVADEERELQDFLKAQGINYGAAQYWVAYRLTFLFEEHPALVPIDPGEDRYKPYRDGFEQATKRAWVFHPSEPRATAEEQIAKGLKASRHEVAGFTVLIEER